METVDYREREIDIHLPIARASTYGVLRDDDNDLPLRVQTGHEEAGK